VSLAYGAVGFVALQAAEIVLPAFLSGFEADAALRVVVVAFLVLFPIVVALAWVYEITPKGIRAMEALDAEAGRPPTGSLMPRVALLVFTVLAAGSAGLWWYRTDSAAVDARASARSVRATPFVSAATTDASGPIHSLAVLPLEDFSPVGDGDGAYFAAGMHEALISQLSQLGTVRVISRTSIEGYQTTGKSLPQVGAELGVDAIVEGSVLRAEGRVRITVQLIHAASDSHLWAQDYERDLQDIIALQGEVARAIAGEIDSRIATGDQDRLAEGRVADDRSAGDVVAETAFADDRPAPVQSPELQDFVMRGRFALRDADQPGAREAERYFQEALSLDSTFAPALTGLAGAHLVRGLEIEGPAALEELHVARVFASRAVAGDAESIEAREVLASTEEALAELVGRLAEMAASDGRDVRIDGDSVVVYVTRGDTARFSLRGAPLASATEMGRFAQSELGSSRRPGRDANDEVRSVARLDMAGRQDEALLRARQALERFPEEVRLWDSAERLSVATGALDDVVALRLDRAEALGPSTGPATDDLAGRIATEGVTGYWDWKLQEYEAREAAGSAVSPVDRAAALSAVGRVEPALSLLEAALEDRDPRLSSLRTDPVWDSLRAEPRFQALLSALVTRLRLPRPGSPR
jgi:TolB-like protein/tetratricopeptide (TPR) repeat protein